MRIQLDLKTKNNFLIPFNYNHILSSIIYNKIADLDYAQKLHISKSFKFFTFSQINVDKIKIANKGLIAKNGKFSFSISSPDEFLIKSLLDGFFEDLCIHFQNLPVQILNIKALKNPEFSAENNFKTISPIVVRKKRIVDGEEKIWDLSPSDEFFRRLENNLIKKYLTFNKLEETDKTVEIYSEMRNVKRKRIAITKPNQNTTYTRAYNMDLILNGDVELIKFAYDCGLGEKNSMGFGMINLI